MLRWPTIAHQMQIRHTEFNSLTPNSISSHRIQITHIKFKSITSNSNSSLLGHLKEPTCFTFSCKGNPFSFALSIQARRQGSAPRVAKLSWRNYVVQILRAHFILYGVTIKWIACTQQKVEFSCLLQKPRLSSTKIQELSFTATKIK